MTRSAGVVGWRRKEAILKQGIETTPSTPEELGAWVKNEFARWTPIIKATGIKAD